MTNNSSGERKLCSLMSVEYILHCVAWENRYEHWGWKKEVYRNEQE